MEKITNIYVIAFSLLCHTIVNAGENSYDCKITNVYTLSETGNLERSALSTNFIGNTFTIQKDTGEIQGEVLTTVLSNKTEVINLGSMENSYKSVAYFSGQVQIVEVQEFKPGLTKPFVASSMGGAGIVTGMCK